MLSSSKEIQISGKITGVNKLAKKLKYKRILLKLTGTLFGYKSGKGINFSAYEEIAKRLIAIWKETGVELAIVVGGGNIFRGRQRAKQVDQATADYMGMLGTVINGMALQEAFERLGAPTRILTAFEIKAVAEPYIRRRAIRHLEKGRIVILTAGVGSPFFTTDSGAALRAVEIDCDVLVKATDVNGIYSDNPETNPKAKLLKHVSYRDALVKNLKALDATAFAICMRQNLPVIVFNIKKLEKLSEIVRGKKIGTLVSEHKS